jgi:uncharacterized protein YcbX
VPALASIHIYPLKSGAPLPCAQATVEPRGLQHDRRWMVVDARGKFLTGRQQPRLTLIRAAPADEGLHLAAPGMPPLAVAAPPPDGARLPATLWNDALAPRLADAAAHAWLSELLGLDCRLVYMDTACRRGVRPDYARAGDEVSFADGFPLLLISQAALDALNARLARPVPMLRFRPNLVAADTTPHAEDGWRRIRIGAAEFDVVKPCTRCVFTTVDFERGAFAADGEPLKTLASYRRTSAGVTFGQNLIPRALGTIRVGDAIEVLA